MPRAPLCVLRPAAALAVLLPAAALAVLLPAVAASPDALPVSSLPGRRPGRRPGTACPRGRAADRL